MAKYLVRAGYNDSGFKGMVSNPSDRGEAIKGITAALGVTTECIYFSPSTAEAIMIVESDAEKKRAAYDGRDVVGNLLGRIHGRAD